MSRAEELDKVDDRRVTRFPCRLGPSHIYLRLLRGQVTPERYVAVLRRAARISRADS